MGLVECLNIVSEINLPKGKCVVRASRLSEEIILYGTNNFGFSVPLDRVDEVADEIVALCSDPTQTYRLGNSHGLVEIPGDRISKVAHYLRQGKHVGSHLDNYEMRF